MSRGGCRQQNSRSSEQDAAVQRDHRVEGFLSSTKKRRSELERETGGPERRKSQRQRQEKRDRQKERERKTPEQKNECGRCRNAAAAQSLSCKVVKHPNRISNEPGTLLPTCRDILIVPDSSAPSRLMTVSTLKRLNPVRNTEGAKTSGLKLTSFSPKPNGTPVAESQSQCKRHRERAVRHVRQPHADAGNLCSQHRSLSYTSATLSTSVLIMSGSSHHPFKSATSELAAVGVVHRGGESLPQIYPPTFCRPHLILAPPFFPRFAGIMAAGCQPGRGEWAVRCDPAPSALSRHRTDGFRGAPGSRPDVQSVCRGLVADLHQVSLTRAETDGTPQLQQHLQYACARCEKTCADQRCTADVPHHTEGGGERSRGKGAVINMAIREIGGRSGQSPMHGSSSFSNFSSLANSVAINNEMSVLCCGSKRTLVSLDPFDHLQDRIPPGGHILN
ncbi:unnamed protein product [Pleuronectes platessa]|uniref:Uncharacterized protein n=1 Tax=Pleuronectes platessa TaxID=8262 RepID=A0A9N7Z2A4_PLEPL|nr:unnamed protein product [Pleuronectes platessa]